MERPIKMAKSILRTALRLQGTRDALLFGKTLSHEERAELRTLVALLRFFKNRVAEDNINLQTKIAWRIQFINEAIAFSEKKPKEPFKKMLDTETKGIYDGNS